MSVSIDQPGQNGLPGRVDRDGRRAARIAAHVLPFGADEDDPSFFGSYRCVGETQDLSLLAAPPGRRADRRRQAGDVADFERPRLRQGPHPDPLPEGEGAVLTVDCRPSTVDFSLARL